MQPPKPTNHTSALPTEEILGYAVTTLNKDQCIDYLVERVIKGGERMYFVCANPHSLEVARKDIMFSKSIQQAGLVVPDGIGIVLASRVLGGKIKKRITGSDLFHGLCQRLNLQGSASCFFLGSNEQTLSVIEQRMREHYPGFRVAGTYSPPYKPEFSAEDNEAMIAAVNRASPDVLWVGMTAPKQEKWVCQNLEKIDTRMVGPVGAVFDFFSGNVRRSHPFFQRIGLEWLPRFLQEPRRLWRRNLVSNPAFITRVLCERARSSLHGT